jgi:hypothetical protein
MAENDRESAENDQRSIDEGKHAGGAVRIEIFRTVGFVFKKMIYRLDFFV